MLASCETVGGLDVDTFLVIPLLVLILVMAPPLLMLMQSLVKAHPLSMLQVLVIASPALYTQVPAMPSAYSTHNQCDGTTIRRLGTHHLITLTSVHSCLIDCPAHIQGSSSSDRYAFSYFYWGFHFFESYKNEFNHIL